MILEPLKGEREGDACGTMLVSHSPIAQLFCPFPLSLNPGCSLTARERVRVPLGSKLPKGEQD